MRVELPQIVADFSIGLREADALRPQAVSFRSGKEYQPGIGPHGENSAVQLVLTQMRRLRPGSYESTRPVSYPGSRQKCDIGIGDPLEWVIEVKMARAFGDNGKLDDTYLKDLLSPYESDHSALSDARKLRESGFDCRKAILVYGYEYPGRQLKPLVVALETLLKLTGPVAERAEQKFTELIHPIHREGLVIAWEILGARHSPEG
jgi:hypothetical protein